MVKPVRPRYDPVRLCTGKAAYEAVPSVPARVDLDQAARSLERTGLAVTHARVMLIIAVDPEVTLGRDGKILVKTRDPAIAQQAIEDVWTRIEASPRSPG